jgi:hypothetical protein
VDIPAGVSSVNIDVCGAQGGNAVPENQGGESVATLAISGPTTLDVVAGEAGQTTNGYRAYGGGGAGYYGSGGGGGSYVFLHNTLTPLVVAGGGGGLYCCGAFPAGAGGGAQGADGAGDNTPATGGTQTAGGAGGDGVAQNGSSFQGGDAAQGCGAGGGGGGYFGGGGSNCWTGAGGSGFITADAAYAASNTASLTGAQAGNGAVRILYANPGAPTPASPVFTTSAFSDTVQSGTPYSRTITVSATPTAAITIDSGTLPTGLTFTDNGDNTATISGTPTGTGSFPLTLRASNGVNPAQTQDDSIVVGTSPAFTSSAFSDTVTAGTPYSRTITVSGYPTAAITIDSGTLPTGLTFTDNGDNTATISGTPTDTGSFPLTLRASNGVQPDATQDDSISVQASPAFTSSAFSDTVTAGTPYSRTITVSATPTAAIAIDSGTLPTGLTFTDNGDNTATISGTPTDTGSFPLTLRASNGVQPDATQNDSISVQTAPSTSPSVSPSASASSSPSGGGGGGTTGGTSPSASPSASSSSPAASSPAGTRQTLVLDINTRTIPAGSRASVTVTGAANQVVDLICYSRPSTTYAVARRTTIDAAGDPVTFSDLALGRNTRCYAAYDVNSAQGASPSQVISVTTVVSLSAVRTAVRTYTFQGRNLPHAAGQLITLYRIDNNGNEIRTANLKTDASGIYRISRHFTGGGTFSFIARTGATLNNIAGHSNVYTVTIH